MYFDIPNRIGTNFTFTCPSLTASLLPSVRCSRYPVQIPPHYLNISHSFLLANYYILLFSRRSEKVKFSILFWELLLMSLNFLSRAVTCVNSLWWYYRFFSKCKREFHAFYSRQNLRGQKLSMVKFSINPGWKKPISFDTDKLQQVPICYATR